MLTLKLSLMINWSCCYPSEEDVKVEVEAFFKWFVQNKATVIKHTMLRPVREGAGLG